MSVPSVDPVHEAPRDCPLCPRLVAFREACRVEYPDWWNAPVPAWGDPQAEIAIIGMAPGKHGANRTGRPFTGDHAGILLYQTLLRFGLATGEYRSDPDDTLRLTGSVILNAVKCLPPENKPTPEEARTCQRYLVPQLASLQRVRVVIALGQIAHGSVVRALGAIPARAKFGHLSEHELGGRILLGSYHCSRYNTNTGKLTEEMFEAVFARALALRNQRAGASF